MIHALTYTGDGTTKTMATLMVASGNYTQAYANNVRINVLQVVTETGGGTVRIGDINTTSSYGLPIIANAGMFFPTVFQEGHTYGAPSIYIYTPNGTVVSLLWDA